MKSSTAIFSRQGNPFPVPAQCKTHYCPSQTQALPAEHQQIVLSPDRARSLPAHLSDTLSPPDLRFLQGSQRLVPESDTAEPFDESWPSSDSSSLKTPERDDPSTSAMKPEQKASAEDSVIARYIARFRSGLPTSRLERSPPKVDLKDFWWLQTSLYPDQLRPEPGMKSRAGLSPLSLEATPSSQDGSLSESKLYPEEADVVTLQKRAEKLIMRSESSLSSGGAVSSEGLGSSSSSSISCPGFDLSRSRQPAAVRAALDASLQPPARFRPALAPEEDILYQWRLRRKMEQAREESLSVRTHSRDPAAWNPKPVNPTVDLLDSFHHDPPRRAAPGPSAPSPEENPRPTPAPITPAYPISSPALAPHASPHDVPPHLHLTCDILPCIQHQDSSPRAQERGAAHCAPSHGHISDLPAQAVERGERVSGPERQDTAASQPDSRKPTQTHQKRTKGKAPGGRKAGMGQEGRTRRVEHPPPASPLHHVMGEVISERLFSPQVSPRRRSDAKKPHPVRLAGAPEPLEIAAQLLEQAEESDGSEFEDDPLLRVLREQRDNLRTRLRAVEQRLVEMESDGYDGTSHFEQAAPYP